MAVAAGQGATSPLASVGVTGRGERTVWKRLKEEHPELERLVGSVTFPDATGRKTPSHATPVVDLEGWLQILALLPGAAGKSA